MQIELSKNDLGMLISWFHDAAALERSTSVESELYKRILAAHAELEELESMDFDDCAGGACKL